MFAVLCLFGFGRLDYLKLRANPGCQVMFADEDRSLKFFINSSLESDETVQPPPLGKKIGEWLKKGAETYRPPALLPQT